MANLNWLFFRSLGVDLVPRYMYEEVDPDLVSVAKLFKLHIEGAEASKFSTKSFSVSIESARI